MRFTIQQETCERSEITVRHYIKIFVVYKIGAICQLGFTWVLCLVAPASKQLVITAAAVVLDLT